MKIKFKTEKYINTPAPKLNSALIDWFWNNFWKVRNNALYGPHKQFPIETIEVTINQALPWSPLHFYISINKSIKYHISVFKEDMKKTGSRKKDFLKYTLNE